MLPAVRSGLARSSVARTCVVSVVAQHAHRGPTHRCMPDLRRGAPVPIPDAGSMLRRKDEEKGTAGTEHTLSSFRLAASSASGAPGAAAPAPALGPVLFAVAVSCAGAFAFGYHLGVVNGPLEMIASDLGIAGDAALSGFIVSSTLGGAAIGSLTGGDLSDSLGRRKGLLLASVPMLVGPLISASASSFAAMAAGRFVAGVAIGLSSALVPTYISEVAPTAIRGALGALNQLMICLGILGALLVNVVLPVEAWRTMFVIGAVPAAALALGMLACPESPRWLQSKGMADEASKAATALWGDAAASEMTTGGGGGGGGSSSSDGDVSLGMLLATKPFKMGLLLFAFQQLAGINALVYFSTSVFRSVGVTSDTLASLAVGATNVVGTIIAASIIEKAGRTSLLSASYFGQGLSMFAMAAGFTLPVLQPYSAPVAVGGTLLYVLSFALGAGPVTALLIPELNPAKTRGRAVAAAFVSHWVCNVIVGQTFMLGVQAYGLPAVYTFFGAVAMGAVAYIKTQVPETRGKSFSEIQKELA